LLPPAWMRTPTGETFPSYAPFPTTIDSRHPSTHRAQHEQNQHTHRRSLSHADLELQDLDTTPQRKHIRKQRPAPLQIGASSTKSENLHLTDESASDVESDREPQMSKRAPKKSNRNSIIPKLSTDSLRDENGHANTTSAMIGLEQRRKHATVDSSSPTSQAASLIGRSSFSLDDTVPPLGEEDGSSKGFSELSKKDQRNFLLLVLLYFLQGIPMGLATGSVPFLLKSVVSYSAIGVFSLAAYPYSLKLFWSPIVDAMWTPRLGRRKSWILPIQTISGFSMLWLGSKVNDMMHAAGEKDGAGIWSFTWWWFGLVFLCATQDIAVDGEISSRILGYGDC